jgi:DNA-binding IclR family transcriptional regulator
MLNGYAVRSVDRAASLLIALGEAPGEAGVSELARLLGLHKSTASRLLSTLQRTGLVEQDEDTGKYRLGPVVVRLGGSAERSLDLGCIAAPELSSLAGSTHDTVTLAVIEGDSALTIACSDGSRSGRDRNGRISPLHATAPGKVLLAAQPEREVVRLFRLGFAPYTPHTIVRVDQLLEELARVRRRAFATDFGEYDPAVNAIAVPILDRRASVVAALEVRAWGSRITPGRVPELVDRAQGAAAAITVRMGGMAPSDCR